MCSHHQHITDDKDSTSEYQVVPHRSFVHERDKVERKKVETDKKFNQRPKRRGFQHTKLIDVFKVNSLNSLQTHLLSKHLHKTLAQIREHYRTRLSIRLNEFQPERVLMEAIVKKFRQYGWFVALFEYGINPHGPGWNGKGDLLLVHPGMTSGKPIALAIEAKILSQTNLSAKRAKVFEQAATYARKTRWLLKDDFKEVCGLPLLAWRNTPDKIMIHSDWKIRLSEHTLIPKFPRDSRG